MSNLPFGQDLALREQHSAHVLIVHVEEYALTSANAPVLQVHLIHRILSGNTHLVIDLSAVESVDAAGLDAMRAALQAAGPDGDVELCGISEPVMNAPQFASEPRVWHLPGPGGGRRGTHVACRLRRYQIVVDLQALRRYSSKQRRCHPPYDACRNSLDDRSPIYSLYL